MYFGVGVLVETVLVETVLVETVLVDVEMVMASQRLSWISVGLGFILSGWSSPW